MSDAPRTANEAAAYLKQQHLSGSTAWGGLCLKLQRTARGLPGVYPSALSAALHTPESERVHRIADLRRGMVAYSDDPNDGNPYGHIYFIIGRKEGFALSDPAGILTWSNDVVAGRYGAVGSVPLSWYKINWGDGFQFGATWLNGYNFSEFDEPPKPERASLGETYQNAMENVRKSIRFHEEKGHDRLVRVLRRDLERMKTHWKNWKPEDN